LLVGRSYCEQREAQRRRYYPLHFRAPTCLTDSAPVRDVLRTLH
jgi:hypothetical protein